MSLYTNNLIKALTDTDISSNTRYYILKSSNKFTDQEIVDIEKTLQQLQNSKTLEDKQNQEREQKDIEQIVNQELKKVISESLKALNFK